MADGDDASTLEKKQQLEQQKEKISFYMICHTGDIKRVEQWIKDIILYDLSYRRYQTSRAMDKR